MAEGRFAPLAAIPLWVGQARGADVPQKTHFKQCDVADKEDQCSVFLAMLRSPPERSRLARFVEGPENFARVRRVELDEPDE